jgi:hypothetical protein
MVSCYSIKAIVAIRDEIFIAMPTRVLVVDGAGIMLVLAGDKEAGFADGKPALFDNITDMAAWPGGGVVVTDRQRVRVIGLDGVTWTLSSIANFRSVCVRTDGQTVASAGGDMIIIPHWVTLGQTFHALYGLAAGADNSVVAYDCLGRLRQTTAAGVTSTIAEIDTGAMPQSSRMKMGVITDTAGMAAVYSYGFAVRVNLATGATFPIESAQAAMPIMALDWFGNLVFVDTEQRIMRVDAGFSPGVGAGTQPAWTPATHARFGARARAAAEAVLDFAEHHVLGELWVHVLGQVAPGGLGNALSVGATNAVIFADFKFA